MSALNPQNHASTFSLVVPVLPARSPRLSESARVAVPTRTTSFRSEVMSHALRGSITRSAALLASTGEASDSTFPLASTIRAIR